MGYLWQITIGIVTTVATCLMTYYVYRLTNKSRRIETYFKHIIELYIKIEEDLQVLYRLEESSEESTSFFSQYAVEQSLRRIKVYTTSMCYYTAKIPGYFDNRTKLLSVLIYISNNPNKFEYYEKLANELQNFCWELKENKTIVHSIPLKYDGRPLSN